MENRKCIKCRRELPLTDFIRTTSKYFPSHRSFICTNCLQSMIDSKNLQDVDALCRYLDIPFNPDEWLSLYDTYGPTTLRAYAQFLAAEPYSTYNWYDESTRWARIREANDTEASIKKFSDAKKKELIERWSSDYSFEELIWLEDFYNKILSTQNVSTPILEEYARSLCEVSLAINKGMRAGVDVKKYMDARDNIIKVAKFDANNSKTATALESVGELMTWVGKKGFHPSYHTEPKDSIDFMMENIQSYNRRLVMNEGNIAEQVDEKREVYDISEKMEDSPEDWKKYDNVAEHLDYEGEADLIKELE